MGSRAPAHVRTTSTDRGRCMGREKTWHGITLANLPTRKNHERWFVIAVVARMSPVVFATNISPMQYKGQGRCLSRLPSKTNCR
jgi:hypothetical protein